MSVHLRPYISTDPAWDELLRNLLCKYKIESIGKNSVLALNEHLDSVYPSEFGPSLVAARKSALKEHKTFGRDFKEALKQQLADNGIDPGKERLIRTPLPQDTIHAVLVGDRRVCVFISGNTTERKHSYRRYQQPLYRQNYLRENQRRRLMEQMKGIGHAA